MEFRAMIRHGWVAGAGAVGLGMCLLTGDSNTPTQAGVVMVMPEVVAGFWGQPGEISVAERVILPGDTEFARMTYTNSGAEQVHASIVLAGGEKRSIHRPEVCLPGQGWDIRSHEVVELEIGRDRRVPLTLLRLERTLSLADGGTRVVRAVYYYSFVGKDVVTASHWKRLFLTSWDRVVKQVNHRWAYVSLFAVVADDRVFRPRDEKATCELAEALGREWLPLILAGEVLESLER